MVSKKLRSVLLITLLLVAVFPTQSFAAGWAEVVYDADVPAKTRENIALAVEAVGDKLAQYQIILNKSITIVVTSDTENYILARMRYGNESRAMAEERAKNSGGASVNQKPIIIIKGIPKLSTYPAEAFQVVAHETFHQLQNQGSLGYIKKPVTLLSEGSAELFRLEVLETGRIGTVKDYIRWYEQAIRKAPAIPDIRELTDSQNFRLLTQKGYPIYQMSVVSASRLIQNRDLESFILYYQLLHKGYDQDKAFLSAFRVTMAEFLDDMNAYFGKMRADQ